MVGLASVNRERSRCRGQHPRVRSWPWLGRGTLGALGFAVAATVQGLVGDVRSQLMLALACCSQQQPAVAGYGRTTASCGQPEVAAARADVAVAGQGPAASGRRWLWNGDGRPWRGSVEDRAQGTGFGGRRRAGAVKSSVVVAARLGAGQGRQCGHGRSASSWSWRPRAGIGQRGWWVDADMV